MRKGILIGVGVTLTVIMFPLLAAANPGSYMKVTPLEVHFGDVDVGSSAQAKVRVYNHGDEDFDVTNIELLGENPDYLITDAPQVPITIPRMNGMAGGYYIEIEITFTPSATGLSEALLHVEGNAWNVQEAYVTIDGNGVGCYPVTIDCILDFFDAGVDDGTIEGRGHRPGQKAAHLKIYQVRLVLAALFLENGWMKGACKLLERSHAFSDGQNGPRDLIEGDAVPELNLMILELMTDLGCL